MKKQVNQQSLSELRQSLAEYETRKDHAGQLVLQRIREAIAIKEQTAKAVDVEVFGQLEETSVADPEEMNDRRSLAALMAVISFSDDIGELPEDGTGTEERRNLLQQNIADMFADLMHLADRVPGLDFEAALETGRMHYTAETEAD